MMEEMTPRDRVLRALSHRTPDKVPRTVKFTPAVQRFREGPSCTTIPLRC